MRTTIGSVYLAKVSWDKNKPDISNLFKIGATTLDPNYRVKVAATGHRKLKLIDYAKSDNIFEIERLFKKLFWRKREHKFSNRYSCEYFYFEQRDVNLVLKFLYYLNLKCGYPVKEELSDLVDVEEKLIFEEEERQYNLAKEAYEKEMFEQIRKLMNEKEGI